MGVFYERILQASATPVRLVPALRAYLVSHLGKYVPGKAMVVVMRAGMVVPFGARASTAAIATFYETLVMMAAGGLVAAVGFAMAAGSGRVDLALPGWGPVELPVYRLAALSGLGLGLAFLVVVLPRGVRAGWRAWSACRSRASVRRPCRGSRARLLVQGPARGRRSAGSCWA